MCVRLVFHFDRGLAARIGALLVATLEGCVSCECLVFLPAAVVGLVCFCNEGRGQACLTAGDSHFGFAGSLFILSVQRASFFAVGMVLLWCKGKGSLF